MTGFDDEDAALDAASAAGWRCEWAPLTIPSQGWRASFVRPGGLAPIHAFGKDRAQACRALVRRLETPPAEGAATLDA